MKEAEMGGTCRTHVTETSNSYNILVEDLRLNGKTVLEWILSK
jgi:hypothetical protein